MKEQIPDKGVPEQWLHLQYGSEEEQFIITYLLVRRSMHKCTLSSK